MLNASEYIQESCIDCKLDDVSFQDKGCGINMSIFMFKAIMSPKVNSKNYSVAYTCQLFKQLINNGITPVAIFGGRLLEAKSATYEAERNNMKK